MPTKLVNGHKHFFQDEGEGPVLVMLHGAGSSSISLQHHFSDLSAKFRIIAPDFRAMGKSDHLSEIPPSSWVDDLAELLKQLSIEKAFIYDLQEYYNLRESFPSVECPVLITRGDRDDNNHKLIYTYELLKGFKDARLAILPDIGFSAAAGKPEEFRGILLGFLNELQQ